MRWRDHYRHPRLAFQLGSERTAQSAAEAALRAGADHDQIGGLLRRDSGKHLGAVADSLAKLEGPVILLGDFNTTPWSPAYRKLVADTELGSASGGRIATWPVWMAPLRVPIDHILVRGPVTVLEAERGPDLGSDHFPVLVTLCVGG